jgi:trimethylamine--corrinoid protein Co-methyltransferase
MAMPSLCSTSPPSIASNLVIGNAEALSAIVLMQLAYPGTPVYYSICPELMNPVTGGVYVSALQKPLLYGGGVNLGHYYNIPVMTYYGGSDSKSVDSWITGKDKAIDAIFVAMTAPEIVIAMGGLLEGYTVCHPELIILDNDIVNSIRETLEGITVNQETLMLDEIRAVGPGGHFLDREITVSNVRKLWNRGVLSKWSPQDNDFVNARNAALEEVKRIVQSHTPKPLESNVKKELRNIIKNAEKNLCT